MRTFWAVEAVRDGLVIYRAIVQSVTWLHAIATAKQINPAPDLVYGCDWQATEC